MSRRASEGPKRSLWDHFLRYDHQDKILSAANSSIGTPHNGSSIAACGEVIADLVGTFSTFRPPVKLLRALRPKSKVLFEITEGFVHKTQNLQLVSFFETQMTSVGFLKKWARLSILVPDAASSNLTWLLQVVERHSAVLNLPNEVAIPQCADHREIARFESLHDRNFRPVLTRINIFKEDILGKVKSITSGQPEVNTGGMCILKH
jgi:hypothetical protein